MTKNKLRKAVSSVLSAWTNWSVFADYFIDELESKFEGREISTSVKATGDADKNDQGDNEVEDTSSGNDDNEDSAPAEQNPSAVSTTPRGTWTSATSVDDADEKGDDIDGEEIDDDIDGEAVDIDGEALDEDIDGEPLEDGDLDGESLDDDDLDGEELSDVDGEDLDDIDGDAIGDE